MKRTNKKQKKKGKCCCTEKKNKSRMASVYLSRGGRGGKSFGSSIKEIQSKIHSIDASVQFVSNPRNAEYIIIPDEGQMLADKTTHAKTKELHKFLTMLRQAVKPVSEKTERGFWQRLTKNPVSDLKMTPSNMRLSKPSPEVIINKKSIVAPPEDKRLFWSNLASPTPGDSLVMSIVNNATKNIPKQPDATLSFLDSVLEQNPKPTIATTKNATAEPFGQEKSDDSVLEPHQAQSEAKTQSSFLNASTPGDSLKMSIVNNATKNILKQPDSTLSFLDSVLEQEPKPTPKAIFNDANQQPLGQEKSKDASLSFLDSVLQPHQKQSDVKTDQADINLLQPRRKHAPSILETKSSSSSLASPTNAAVLKSSGTKMGSKFPCAELMRTFLFFLLIRTP